MEYKYKAFISYRHVPRDAAAAKALKHMLERYVIPEDSPEKLPEKVGAIFWDNTNLAANPDLRHTIYEALDSSEYLIVICSREIMDPEHPWVLEEIQHFLRVHPGARNRVLTVLAGDEPEEAIPEFLRIMKPEQDGTEQTELPFFVDIRGKNRLQMSINLRREFLRICATLLSCHPDRLAMREQKRRNKQNLWRMAGITAVASVIIGILLWSNWQIEGKNTELERQNNEILLNTAQEYLSSGDRASAIRTVLQTFDSTSSAPEYNAPAEELLIRALGFFDEGGPEPLVLQSALDHVNPISDFCLSDDGSKAFVVDINSYVVCLDIQTGTAVWEQHDLQEKMIAPDVGYATLFQPSIRIGDKAILAAGDTLVLHDYRTAIIALSQQTGQELWVREADLGYFGCIFCSGDENTIAYVESEYTTDDTILKIIFLDTSTGEVYQEIPLARRSAPSRNRTMDSLVLRGSSAGLEPGGALSSDGRFFAGSYLEQYADETSVLYYYIADQLTGECRVISRREGSISPDYYGVKVLFTDNDETLTFIRSDGDDDCSLTIEKYDLSGKCLWKQTTPSDPERDFQNLYRLPCLIAPKHILLGLQNRLYLLDGASGELLSTTELSAPVLDLYPAGEEIFALLLENGEYRTGQISAEGLSRTMLMCTLSAAQKLDSCTFAPDASDHPLDGGTVAIVPTENPYRVELTKLVPLEGIYKNIDTGVNSWDYSLSESYHIFPDENTIIVGEASVINPEAQSGDTLLDLLYAEKYALIDTRTNLLREYTGIPWFNFQSCWLQNGECIMKYDNSGNIDLVVPSPDYYCKCITMSRNQESDMTGIDDLVVTGYLSDLALRSSDQTAIAIVCRDDDMAYFQIQGIENGKAKGTITTLYYPDELITGITHKLKVGSNNFFAIPYMQEGSEFYTHCAFFDLETMKGSNLTYAEGEYLHEIWFANQRPLCAILRSGDILSILDMTAGEYLCHIPLAVPYSSVIAAQFILDDQYLMVHTAAGQIDIYDCSTGEPVYSEWGADLYSSDALHYVEDPENHRLYIQKEHHIGALNPGGNSASCLDTRTWTKIAEIPGFVTLDPRSNTIYRLVTVDQGNHLFACSLPTTEELVELGKQFLGQ